MNPTKANLATIDTWMQRLADETDAAAHSAEMTRYLNALAKFWHYSSFNTLLIALQRPEATRVASKSTWARLGRTIKPGEERRAIQILCPHFRKTRDAETGEEREVLTHFSTGHVYDIAQTTGAPLPGLTWHQVDGDYRALLDALIAAAHHMGIAVELHHDMPARTHGWSDGTGTIALNGRDSTGSLCQTALHELAHELLHDARARRTVPRSLLEAQAEAVAYCACQALGLPAVNAPQYLAFYGIDRQALSGSMDAIRAGVARILRALEAMRVNGSEPAVA